jgi:hypothetical protein
MATPGYADKQLKMLEAIEEAKMRVHNLLDSEKPN